MDEFERIAADAWEGHAEVEALITLQKMFLEAVKNGGILLASIQTAMEERADPDAITALATTAIGMELHAANIHRILDMTFEAMASSAERD